MTGTPFTWDVRARRYRDAGGRFVSRTAVRRALDDTLENTGKRMNALAVDLRDGRISLDQWADEMRSTIKSVHLYSTAAARGGWDQMTPADFGRVGRLLRDQYGYLDRFVADIEAGLPLGGAFLFRVRMYLQSGRRSYYRTVRVQLPEGFTQARSIRHAQDSCDDCLAEAAAGWQPIDDMIPVGDRECLSSCKCTEEYRNPDTGEMIA